MTAVEFLVKEINKLTGLTIEMDEPCVEQAKEMELDKLKESYSMGRMGKSIKEFNETFKK
jgi:hypothetical protein